MNINNARKEKRVWGIQDREGIPAQPPKDNKRMAVTERVEGTSFQLWLEVQTV